MIPELAIMVMTSTTGPCHEPLSRCEVALFEGLRDQREQKADCAVKLGGEIEKRELLEGSIKNDPVLVTLPPSDPPSLVLPVLVTGAVAALLGALVTLLLTR